MEPVKFGMSDAWNPHVATKEKREGLLGSLGAREKLGVTTVMCPECGLLRLFADIDD